MYDVLSCDSSGSETTRKRFLFSRGWQKKTNPLWAMENIPWNQMPNATRPPLSAYQILFVFCNIYSAGRMDFQYTWAVYLLFHMHFTQILHTISISLTVVLALWRYIAIKWVWRMKSSRHCSYSMLFAQLGTSWPLLCECVFESNILLFLDTHTENWHRLFYRIVDQQFSYRSSCRPFSVFPHIFCSELTKPILWMTKTYMCAFTMSTWMKIPLCMGECDLRCSWIRINHIFLQFNFELHSIFEIVRNRVWKCHSERGRSFLILSGRSQVDTAAALHRVSLYRIVFRTMSSGERRRMAAEFTCHRLIIDDERLLSFKNYPPRSGRHFQTLVRTAISVWVNLIAFFLLA